MWALSRARDTGISFITETIETHGINYYCASYSHTSYIYLYIHVIRNSVSVGSLLFQLDQNNIYKYILTYFVLLSLIREHIFGERIPNCEQAYINLRSYVNFGRLKVKQQ